MCLLFGWRIVTSKGLPWGMKLPRRCLLVLLFAWSLQAQSDEAHVHAVVTEMLRAIGAHDGATLYQLILPDADVVAAMPDGTLRKLRADEFIRRSVSSKEAIQERIWDAQVSVHSDIATLVAPYDFFREGRRSHCGVNAITLLKATGGWRVATVFFTMRLQGCQDSPLDIQSPAAKPRRR